MALRRIPGPDSSSTSDYEDAMSDATSTRARSSRSFGDGLVDIKEIKPNTLTPEEERDRFERVYQYVLQQYAKKFDRYEEDMTLVPTSQSFVTSTKSNSSFEQENVPSSAEDMQIGDEFYTPFNYVVSHEDPFDSETVDQLLEMELEETEPKQHNEWWRNTDVDQQKQYEIEEALKAIGRHFMPRQQF